MSFKTFVAHGFLHSAASAIEPATRALSQVANTAMPNDIPSAAEVMDLALRGWIDEATLATYCSMNGVALDPGGVLNTIQKTSVTQNTLTLWNTVWLAKQELPTVQEFLTLANRMRLTDPQLDIALKRLGYYSERVREDVSHLRYEIPSSSDLVRFSVRHVFEPDLIAKLGYNDEFRPILDLWHRFQGLNYPIFTGPFAAAVEAFEEQRGLPPGRFSEQYAAAGLEDPTWAQAFWWAHWVLPSATQGYEMYFRYRPDRDRRFDAPGTSKIDFSREDLELLLRANDYPPYYRAALAGIAHRIPGIRFLRQLRATGVFDKGMVLELLRRQGYSPGDAEVLAESVERNDRDQRRRTVEQQAKGQLAKYWELGILDDAGYNDLLVKHGMLPQDAADTINVALLDLQFRRVEKIVAFVRRQYIRGAIDKDQAGAQLKQAGVTLERIALYLEDWGLELRDEAKHVAAQKAVQWSCRGIISVDDLNTRLTNLGYSPEDRRGLTQEAIVCQQGLAARALAATEKARRAQTQLLKRQQKDAAQAIVTARRQLASHGSPAQLRKWYCAGHVGEMEVYSRLRFLGWPDVDITRLIGDCKSVKGTGSGGPRGGATIAGRAGQTGSGSTGGTGP